MSAIDLAVGRLKTDEGFRAVKYTDTTGHETIGYGFNVDAGISQYAAAQLLTAQTTELATDLRAYSWFVGLDDVRASVLCELAFNLGLSGLLHFPAMLSAIGASNWQGAHDELLNSTAAKQLPARYSMLANLLLNGGSS